MVWNISPKLFGTELSGHVPVQYFRRVWSPANRWYLQRVSNGCMLNLDIGLNFWQYAQCCEDMTSLVRLLSRRTSTIELTATCPWQRRTFKLEYIDCGLTWRAIDSAGYFFPSHAMNTSTAFNPDIWRQLVRCSVGQQPYDHTRSWDRWWSWGIMVRYIRVRSRYTLWFI